MWWMRPEWKDTLCARCGRNIWDSGGDPDHGVCYDCFVELWREREQEADHYREEEEKENRE